MLLHVLSDCCTLATRIESVLCADNNGGIRRLTNKMNDSVEQREQEGLVKLGNRELDIL
jgi:hypothetical protein